MPVITGQNARAAEHAVFPGAAGAAAAGVCQLRRPAAAGRAGRRPTAAGRRRGDAGHLAAGHGQKPGRHDQQGTGGLGGGGVSFTVRLLGECVPIFNVSDLIDGGITWIFNC